MCSLERLEKSFPILTLKQRADLLARCMQLEFIKGNAKEVSRIFNTYCADPHAEFFVRPNIDILYTTLMVEMVINRNQSRAFSIVEQMSHCDLYSEHLKDTTMLLYNLFDKRNVKMENLEDQVASSVEIHNRRLESMHKDHVQRFEKELSRESRTNMYDMNRIYEMMKQ